jgi:excisionase family DNA binding protein
MSTVLLSISQAAERANVSYGTMYRMVRDGRIACIRFGKVIRIKSEDIGISNPDEQISTPHLEQPKEEESSREESLYMKLRPQIEKVFSEVPSYGEVGFRVILHDSRVVRFECSSSVMVKMETEPSMLQSKPGRNNHRSY